MGCQSKAAPAVESRRRVWKVNVEAILESKWEFEVEGTGEAWIMYPGTGLPCLLQVGVGGGARQRPMTTKGPQEDSDIDAVEVHEAKGPQCTWSAAIRCLRYAGSLYRAHSEPGQGRGGAGPRKGPEAAICASPRSS